MLRAPGISLALSCRSCLYRAVADLKALCKNGRGDTPIIEMLWRCSQCGSRRVSAVVVGESKP